MLADWMLVGVGLALLLAGGEVLVRGASGIGLLARLSPSLVGLTIVSVGTSLPELFVSLQAALEGDQGVTMGNVVGSNLFNIGVVLGATALVRPLRLQASAARLEWPVMLVAACLLQVLVWDGDLDRLEAGTLLVAEVAFLAYLVRGAGKLTPGVGEVASVGAAKAASRGAKAWLLQFGAVGVGVALLAVGADVMVDGAVGVATALGVPAAVIGLTVVAAGTSTPELVTSLVAAARGREDIAVTNVLGSNIFNILGIVGITGLVQPIPVLPSLIDRDNWWMLGLSALLLPLMIRGRRLSRLGGLVLLASYAAYMAVLLTGLSSE